MCGSVSMRVCVWEQECVCMYMCVYDRERVGNIPKARYGHVLFWQRKHIQQYGFHDTECSIRLSRDKFWRSKHHQSYGFYYADCFIGLLYGQLMAFGYAITTSKIAFTIKTTLFPDLTWPGSGYINTYTDPVPWLYKLFKQRHVQYCSTYTYYCLADLMYSPAYAQNKWKRKSSDA